jgi:hypothetical protein
LPLDRYDEEGTLTELKALRKTLFDPKIAKHHGRIVKNTGDGALVEFASVVDAVRCADEIQRGVAEQNIDVQQVKRIEFRIGIHVGDIIVDENDIFGDGVNIAVRLEGIAEPGGVCISDDAYRQIRGKVEITCEDSRLMSRDEEGTLASSSRSGKRSSIPPSPNIADTSSRPLETACLPSSRAPWTLPAVPSRSSAAWPNGTPVRRGNSGSNSVSAFTSATSSSMRTIGDQAADRGNVRERIDRRQLVLGPPVWRSNRDVHLIPVIPVADRITQEGEARADTSSSSKTIRRLPPPCMEPKIIILRSEAIPAAQSWQVAKTAQKREEHARLRVYNPNTPTSWAAISGEGHQRPQPLAQLSVSLYPAKWEVHT